MSKRRMQTPWQKLSYGFSFDSSTVSQSSTLNYKSSSLPISLLADSVLLLSFSKEEIKYLISGILKMAFFTAENRFFSFTVTEDEVSLIVSVDSLHEIEQLKTKDQTITISPGKYKVIQIYEGPDVLDETGLISFISSRLQTENIPIIYLSTFNTDLILVREEHAEKAFKYLTTQTPPLNPSPNVTTQPATIISKNQKQKLNSQMSVIKLENNVLDIVTCSKSNLPHLTHSFLKEILFPDPNQRFFSLTICGNDATFVVDNKAAFSGPHLQIHTKLWCCLQVTAGSSGSSGASVHAISATLAKHDVSLYFLGTFGSDFVLVREEQSKQALKVLQEINVLT